jgi:hypothetical protein
MNRRRRWKSRKTRKTPWLPIIAGLLIGVPLGLELLARIAVGVLDLKVDLPGTTPQEPSLVEAYQIQFVTPQGEPYPTVGLSGQLLAQRHPLLGYTLVPNQQNPFWKINAQGFRDDDPLEIAKAPNEIRIFILGESTAFGQLSSSNQTLFSRQLEAKLNKRIADQKNNSGQFQPEVLPYRADQVETALARPPQIKAGQYRVINAAVPGYASGNSLAEFVHQVAGYNPDILVIMGGYADLLLPSDQAAADIPDLDALLQNKPLQTLSDRSPTSPNLADRFLNAWFLVKVFRAYYLKLPKVEPEQPPEALNLMTPTPTAALGSQLAADEPELQRRIDRYQYNLKQLVYWVSANRKRLLIVMPPEITGQSADQLTESEKAILAGLDARVCHQLEVLTFKILYA